jgi:hypothetical protein
LPAADANGVHRAIAPILPIALIGPTGTIGSRYEAAGGG